MDFEKVVKYSGFALTVVSLIIGIDYFIHNILISVSIIALASGISILAYFSIFRFNQTFGLRILNHEVKIDLQDTSGALAYQTRTTKFLALKDKITSFIDHMSADGDLEVSSVSPGTLEDIRREGGDLFLTTNFGKVLSKGEIIDKEIKTILKNTFESNPEYWSVRIILPTKEFKLIIIFPINRPYKNFRGYQRITSHEMIAETQPIETLISGRPALVWSVKAPKLKDVYKIIWEW